MTCICKLFTDAHYHANENPHDITVKFDCPEHGAQQRYWLIHEQKETYCVPCNNGFMLGDRVRKIKGSEWQGIIVGSYKTDLTPKGWVVESELHKGSCQLYPESALEKI